MATIEELENGLRKAHAAGNTDHARAFANEIRRMRDSAPDFSNVQSRVETRQGMPQQPIDPTEGMSGYERFMAGAGKSVMDSYRGLKQMSTQNWLQGARALSGLAGAVGAEGAQQFIDRRAGKPIAESLAAQQAEIDESKRLDAPLMDTGAGFAGNVAGYGAQIVGPGLAVRGTTAAGAFLPATIRGNIAQGAVLGTAQPTATGESRAANAALGAAGGAGGALLGRALSGVGTAGLNAIRGLRGTSLTIAEARAGRAIMDESATGLQNLMQVQPSAVPGVRRTLGEETLDPGVTNLERIARQQTPQAFQPQDIANNAARVRALQNIAGTDADMAAAEAARREATGELRERAFAEGEDATAAAMRSGFTPAQNVSRLRDQIATLAQQQGGRRSVQRALNDVVAELDDAAPSVRGLYNVRKSINDLIEGRAGSDRSYAQAATSELLDARRMLDEEVANLAPSFGEYLTAFQNMSQPINRMQVGRELIERGSARARDASGVPRLTPGQFEGLAGDLDTLAQRATGFRRARAENILTADHISSIRSIQDDLRRMFQRDTMPGRGSPTYGLQEGGRRVARRAARAVAAVTPGGNYISELAAALEAGLDQRVKERIAYLLANPDEARRVIGALNQQDRRAVRNALMAISARFGSSAGASGAERPPVELTIRGGTPGEAVSEAELRALRQR